MVTDIELLYQRLGLDQATLERIWTILLPWTTFSLKLLQVIVATLHEHIGSHVSGSGPSFAEIKGTERVFCSEPNCFRCGVEATMSQDEVAEKKVSVGPSVRQDADHEERTNSPDFLADPQKKKTSRMWKILRESPSNGQLLGGQHAGT